MSDEQAKPCECCRRLASFVDKWAKDRGYTEIHELRRRVQPILKEGKK